MPYNFIPLSDFWQHTVLVVLAVIYGALAARRYRKWYLQHKRDLALRGFIREQIKEAMRTAAGDEPLRDVYFNRCAEVLIERFGHDPRTWREPERKMLVNSKMREFFPEAKDW